MIDLKSIKTRLEEYKKGIELADYNMDESIASDDIDALIVALEKCRAANCELLQIHNFMSKQEMFSPMIAAQNSLAKVIQGLKEVFGE